jgi:DNA-binding NarL/FixJ family response regulator
MRVLVAEDHALIRAGLVALLDQMPGVSVVAEASEGSEAVRLAREHQPDVALLDISMPGTNGLEAAQQIVQELSAVKIIMVSVHANEEYVWQALRAGASGYVLKDASAAELEHALAAVVRGEIYLSPSVSRLLDNYVRLVGDPSPLERLTPRQREILQLIAEGHTNRAIAGILGISIKTVDTHRTQLMETLGIHDVATLVRFALRVGLIR